MTQTQAIPEGGGAARQARASAAPSRPPDSDRDTLLKGIFSELDQRIEPVAKTEEYQVYALLAGLAAVLVPLCYLGLAGLVAYGLIYRSWLLVISGTLGRWGFVFHAGLILSGAVVLFFMFKPIFSWWRRDKEERFALDPNQHADFYAYVHRVCDLVGAPRPREIRVDCEINASAGLRRGLLSWLRRDLVLTVGLPLVAGLNLRQLTGVLAHEFGHFSQRTGMGLTYLSHTLNSWLAHVVFERDAWDERLSPSHSTSLFRKLLLTVAAAFVWLVRKVLMVLVVAAHGITCALGRAMERDADEYAARMVGSEVSAGTLQELNVLAWAKEKSWGDFEEAMREHRFVDDLPALFMAKHAEMDPREREAVLNMLQQEQTGPFDIHPAMRERLAYIRDFKQRGILRRQASATVLFPDFRKLCRQATRAMYQARMPAKVFESIQIVPTETVLAE